MVDSGTVLEIDNQTDIEAVVDCTDTALKVVDMVVVTPVDCHYSRMVLVVDIVLTYCILLYFIDDNGFAVSIADV
jgi:hypothetical protein